MKKLYELCYGVEPEEKDLLLLEIKHQRLLDNGLTKENQCMQAIGYKEIIDYFIRIF